MQTVLLCNKKSLKPSRSGFGFGTKSPNAAIPTEVMGRFLNFVGPNCPWEEEPRARQFPPGVHAVKTRTEAASRKSLFQSGPAARPLCRLSSPQCLALACPSPLKVSPVSGRSPPPGSQVLRAPVVPPGQLRPVPWVWVARAFK